jgi:hypothetical protein
LYNPVQASSDGGLNLEPGAWEIKDTRKNTRQSSRFPAQVAFSIMALMSFLDMENFKHLLNSLPDCLSSSVLQRFLFQIVESQCSYNVDLLRKQFGLVTFLMLAGESAVAGRETSSARREVPPLALSLRRAKVPT